MEGQPNHSPPPPGRRTPTHWREPAPLPGRGSKGHLGAQPLWGGGEGLASGKPPPAGWRRRRDPRKPLTMTQVPAVVVLVDDCWTRACSFCSWANNDLQHSQDSSGSGRACRSPKHPGAKPGGLTRPGSHQLPPTRERENQTLLLAGATPTLPSRHNGRQEPGWEVTLCCPMSQTAARAWIPGRAVVGAITARAYWAGGTV